MDEHRQIRVVEIRQAQNGWVVSAFERGGRWCGGDVGPYFSMVAETPERCTELLGELLKRDSWTPDVSFQPVRREPE